MTPQDTPVDGQQDGTVGGNPSTPPVLAPDSGPATTMRLSAVNAVVTPEAAAPPAGTGVDTGTIASLQPGTALLRVDHGPNAGSRFLLDAELVTVGRSPSSDIFLDDVTVSRKHAQFTRVPGGYAVKDVGSLNGTYVNRERIDEVQVRTGDEVQIGKFRLVVHLSPAPSPAAQ